MKAIIEVSGITVNVNIQSDRLTTYTNLPKELEDLDTRDYFILESRELLQISKTKLEKAEANFLESLNKKDAKKLSEARVYHKCLSSITHWKTESEKLEDIEIRKQFVSDIKVLASEILECQKSEYINY